MEWNVEFGVDFGKSNELMRKCPANRKRVEKVGTITTQPSFKKAVASSFTQQTVKLRSDSLLLHFTFPFLLVLCISERHYIDDRRSHFLRLNIFLEIYFCSFFFFFFYRIIDSNLIVVERISINLLRINAIYSTRSWLIYLLVYRMNLIRYWQGNIFLNFWLVLLSIFSRAVLCCSSITFKFIFRSAFPAISQLFTLFEVQFAASERPILFLIPSNAVIGNNF